MIKKINNIQILLSPWINNIPQKKICNITQYSNTIKSGDLFISLQKKKIAKKNHILTALKKKASVILYETEKNKHGLCISTQFNTLIIYFKKLSHYIHQIYERFFNNPQKKIKIIGVIGTYGKTTVVSLIAQWEKLINKKIGIIKNLENSINIHTQSSYNNINYMNSIQKKLYHLVKKKIDIIIIEMSYHVLMQKQMSNLKFESVICTNLTNNLIDGQKNMFQKEKIKFSFLKKNIIKNIILNGDENIANNWINKFKNKNVISVTIFKKNNVFNTKFWINAIKIIYSTSRTKIFFNSSWGSGKLYSLLLGNFNITNILLAMTSMLLLNYSINILVQSSKFLKPIRRKMEKIQVNQSPLFVINNVHLPQILYRALYSLTYYNCKKIWCILGYEEIKNISTRKIVGNIIGKFSDFIVFINNYPQNKQEKLILQDILNECNKKNKFFIFYNIKQAIQFIFSQTNKYDIIYVSEKENKVRKIIKYIHTVSKKNSKTI
ncbi:UDP-N-acetylmuramoyl-L-alanyl-D-glutamate--2, 6-diaminopimelate ligase [Buchnera aphidicola (Cinara pseudotaxifoliae)]|uniref:UDP-N-acetylmuramoyl-L-alanyl-D-glutamate--2, 6-diaminopimelate ligase n=1 Tax=Buchnera aphidicola (Cinara pseudotaxifoliae) TaxID=655384 RepID=A0A451DGQ8_9GAMM|nr:Mur ligase family protein [Buchnera aphidicola]VFP85806.1 UDP-N-acetylmuramoyl-L-alanyl-D-glutamate--2, 6-diaminopimelate ligase [Buchnera aphidicola (Cinara pseudotaxifoliae)]